MTKLLDQAIAAVSELPAEMQDEIARIMLSYRDENKEVYVLTPEEEADLDEAEREVERGEMASEEEVHAILRKYLR